MHHPVQYKRTAGRLHLRGQANKVQHVCNAIMHLYTKHANIINAFAFILFINANMHL